jgi:xanthine dehydrogenase accessory factor
MKVLIKGAGDLATGIASRLYRSGHQIIMTEIEAPLTVRRTVALSRAVYEGKAVVEDMTGIRVDSMEEAQQVQQLGDIPVIVDESAEIIEKYRPHILVDAILAKRNMGTRITDAPFVIGVGPGFYAGLDCHCVIETMRGHELGNVIYQGGAIPNTGIPGEIDGFSIERLIRAAGEGVIEPRVVIGDLVKQGQLVAVTGGKEVFAQMGGIVRGMLQPGVWVKENMKIGDIDSRSAKSHCYTISDKARAIGGGVLEAAACFENTYGKYAIIILAAGKSRRFGSNKLTAVISGRPMYQHTLKRLEGFKSFPGYWVTGSNTIEQEVKTKGLKTVINNQPDLGISHSIRLGLEACLKDYPHIQGVLFSVCDQPNLQPSTIQRIFNMASLHQGQIICTSYKGQTGNPVLWDRQFFPQLMSLSGDQGGRQLIKGLRDKVRYVEARGEELKDIDYKTDM